MAFKWAAAIFVLEAFVERLDAGTSLEATIAAVPTG
jgi:hypothetical protein